jgi:hypothetical protein
MGVVDAVADLFTRLGGGHLFLIYTIIVWASVLVSAFIDNIPYVATMLPVTQGIAMEMGVDPTVLYFGLLSGATLGGNLTPMGASANITGIGMLRKEGWTVRNRDFFRIGIPFTLAATIPAYISTSGSSTASDTKKDRRPRAAIFFCMSVIPLRAELEGRDRDVDAAVALAAQTVGAVGALQRAVRALPEALRVERESDLPDDEDGEGGEAERPGEEPGDEDDRREHHHVVPVEDAAGGAAAVLHEPDAERTPEQHADEIEDEKEHRDDQQHVAGDPAEKVAEADHGGQQEQTRPISSVSRLLLRMNSTRPRSFSSR